MLCYTYPSLCLYHILAFLVVALGLKNAPLVLWQTSNGAWAIIALLMYFIFPYDLKETSAASRGPLSLEFFVQRFPLWLCMTLIFYSFWHVTLYGLAFSSRPFVTVGGQVEWCQLEVCCQLNRAAPLLCMYRAAHIMPTKSHTIYFGA